MSSQPRYLSLNRRPGRTTGHRVLSTLPPNKAVKYVPLLHRYMASTEIFDVEGTPLQIRKAGLLDEPAVSMDVYGVDIKGTKISLDSSDLKLCISPSHLYIYFTLNEGFIDGSLVSREKHLRLFHFGLGGKSLLAVLHSGDYVYAKHKLDDRPLFEFFKTQRHWGVSPVPRIDNAEFQTLMDDLTRKRKESAAISTDQGPTKLLEVGGALENCLLTLNKDGALTLDTGETLVQQSDANSFLASTPSGDLAPLNSGGRVTRSNSKPSSSEIAEVSSNDLELMPDYEEPAPFDPPLKHQIGPSQTFVISYSDFKTLYNNSWINDSLIDFFIAYEIDRAEKTRAETPIHALNSFFFTKLIQRPPTAPDTEPDYYGNIKRWLSKLDLAAFPYIVMPINENLHWYCCIIKGLPSLLQFAQERKAIETDYKAKNEANESFKGDSPLSELETGSPDVSGTDISAPQPSSALDKDPSGATKPTPRQKKSKVEIFVFDSLNQKHYNIHYPLRKFIMDYVKDKYDLEVRKDEIRVQSARVPKQTNFNDCGIHVIYNVRRWLSDPGECERVWRSHSKYALRTFFLPQERNRMRVDFISLLLELHEQQQKDPKSSSEEVHSDHSDGDIEVIEYQPERPTKGPPSAPRSTENEEIQKTSDPKKVPDGELPRTLDPKSAPNEALGTLNTVDEAPLIALTVSNPSLRTVLGGRPLKQHTVAIFNDLFSTKTEMRAESTTLLVDFASDINKLDAKKDAESIKELIMVFMHRYSQLKAIPRPRHTALVIKHYDDSSDDLQQSVLNLKISSESEPVERDGQKEIEGSEIDKRVEESQLEKDKNYKKKEDKVEHPSIEHNQVELSIEKDQVEEGEFENKKGGESNIEGEAVQNIGWEVEDFLSGLKDASSDVSENDSLESDDFVVLGEALVSRKRNHEQKRFTPQKPFVLSGDSNLAEKKDKPLKVEEIEKTTQASLKQFLKGSLEQSNLSAETRLIGAHKGPIIPFDSKEDSQSQSDSSHSVQEIKMLVGRSRKRSPTVSSGPKEEDRKDFFAATSPSLQKLPNESDSDEVSFSKIVYVKRNSGMRKDGPEDHIRMPKNNSSSTNKPETQRNPPGIALSPFGEGPKSTLEKNLAASSDVGSRAMGVKYTGRVSLPLKQQPSSKGVLASREGTSANVLILVDVSSEDEVEVVSSGDDAPRITAVKAADEARTTRSRKAVVKDSVNRTQVPERREKPRVGVPQDSIIEYMRSPVGKIKRRRLNGNK